MIRTLPDEEKDGNITRGLVANWNCALLIVPTVLLQICVQSMSCHVCKMFSPVSGEGAAEVEMEWKVLQVDMQFVLLQPDGRLDVDEEQPEEHSWKADSL